jgi:hypothetical protein
MNWFQQNRFLGTFLIVTVLAALGSLYFISSAKSGFTEAKARFDENANALNDLQRRAPFPSDANLRKMKTQADDYNAELNKLKEELKARVLPAVPMAPNEFQARLRQAVTALGDKARANRVKLPDNFFLGFDEFASALPDTAAAPQLGQQLAQAELLMNILLDARVESVTTMRRVPATEALIPTAATATPTPAGARKPGQGATPAPVLVERAVVEVAFVSSPGAARRVINQVAAAQQQFYIIRTLHVLNEKDAGPPRDAAPVAGAPVVATPAPSGATPNLALNFIVGTERVQTSARIEMLRFAF